MVLLVTFSGLARADLFSPGELSKAHQGLEGLSQCTKCHPAGGQLSPEKCLDCHGELKPRLERGLGLHGRLPDAQKATCEKCHREHLGRAFGLLGWGAGGEKGFDHHRTGWPLEGGHAKLECDDCHQKRLVKDPAVLKLLELGRDSKLGAPKACAGCHFDEHRGQVEGGCDACHTVKAWKPVPGFDHDKTRYPLEGRHEKVKCNGCHPSLPGDEPKGVFPAPKAATYLKLGGLEFRKCTDCHEDPHEGRFGPRCASCHSVQGWRHIRNAEQDRGFHQKTRYPLEGEHLEVACKSCHGPFPGRPAKFKNLAFGACTDCHADAHLGQLSAPKSAKATCDGCHSLEGFSPASYELERHQQTGFPLSGAHTVASCRGCHPTSAALQAKVPASLKAKLQREQRPVLVSLTRFTSDASPKDCVACHADPHKGQLDAKPCEACHRTERFSAVTFDHAKDSRFPLVGAHQKLECSKCHGADGKGVVRYRPLGRGCAGCHADVHAGQFASPEGTACERCHDETRFTPAKGFVHGPPFTTFVLDGAHAQVKCGGCHPTVALKSAKVTRYRPLPRTCEGCHADFHRGAFQGFTP